jgi:tetratricopeptide (TPR) repeat protein
MNKPVEAEERYAEACGLYSLLSPVSPNYAICLCSLASLYIKNGRKYDAAQKLNTAISIYEAIGDSARVSKFTAIRGSLGT